MNVFFADITLDEKIQIAVAGATLLLALFTGLMFYQTRRLAQATNDLATGAEAASFREIGVRAWMQMSERFDSTEMEQARRKLAAVLINYRSPEQQWMIAETVLNFFEDLGILYKQGYIDKQLAMSTFSFYVCRWWDASKSYIEDERRSHNADASLFKEFQWLAEQMRNPDDKITTAELRQFLLDEQIQVVLKEP